MLMEASGRSLNWGFRKALLPFFRRAEQFCSRVVLELEKPLFYAVLGLPTKASSLSF